MVATGYPAMCCGTGRTRTGRRATYGVVAVDPRVIPLGTMVYVEGYGLALACDTGGAIKGHRIDLCYDSNYEANRYGRKHVKVHILR
jgi:3D (Asp-Asp-Asp) domain-containing protein